MLIKRLFLGAALLAITASPAAAATIGVSVAQFEDTFLTTIRQAMAAEAKAQGHDINFLDAQGDSALQLSQVQKLAADGIDAIIIIPVDTSVTSRMTGEAVLRGIPLVYANREPEGNDLDQEGVVFVGSDQRQAGTLQMEALAERLGGQGNAAIMLGELSSGTTHERTESVKEVAANYSDIEIIKSHPADYQRTLATDLMKSWLADGVEIDAIAANNDEMALGALMAMEESGISPDDILVAGIDATPDALASMQDGKLALTVFQDAGGQGAGAVQSAIAMINGETVDDTMVPFQLITPDNLSDFIAE